MSENEQGKPLDASETAREGGQGESTDPNVIGTNSGDASSFDARISNGDGQAYNLEAEASGGWKQFSTGAEPGPSATGANSLLSLNTPEDEGNKSYTVTALKKGPDFAASEDGSGYAAPNTFVDREGVPAWYDTHNGNSRKPTTTAIIEWASHSSGKGKRPYQYTDFVFCKHWQKIPNNYLLTLRRFPFPAFDNLQFPGEHDDSGGGGKKYVPMAQALTYIGDGTDNALDSIVTFTTELPYENVTADVHQISGQGNGSGDAGPAAGFAKVLGILSGDAKIKEGGQAPADPYNNGPYMNKIQGPVNRIDSTKQRKAGLKFEQSFALKFHYKARPIGGANTKAVMLDIIANILLLTYAEASFWGGSHRFTGGSPQYPFLGGQAGFDALYSGDIGGFFDAFTEQLSRAGENVSDIFNSVLSGDPIEGLKSLAAGGAKLGIESMLAGKKNAALQIPALLTGNPVGQWHLTVGNPFNPIMEIGNLVCTKCTFTLGKELGPDDFPTELTAEITLEHGMPRDSAAVQSMFNRGGGKIYHIPDEYQFGYSANATPGEAGSKIDPNSGTNSSSGKSGSNSTRRKSILQGNPADVDAAIDGGKRVGKIGQSTLEAIKMGTGYGNGK